MDTQKDTQDPRLQASQFVSEWLKNSGRNDELAMRIEALICGIREEDASIADWEGMAASTQMSAAACGAGVAAAKIAEGIRNLSGLKS